MNNVILTVWNKGGVGAVLDLYGQDTINLNFNFNSITSLEPGETFSQEFRIPATANNCGVFGIQQDFNVVAYNGTTSNIKKKFKAVITVDTVPISEGFVQFKSSFIKQGKMADFSIVFFGDQVDLGTNLKDLDFTALDYSDAVHSISFSNLKDVNDGGTVGGNDYSDHKLMWTMIDNGQKFMTYPSDLDGTFVNAPYSYTGFFQPDNMITPLMLTPALKGSYLLNKINEYLLNNQKKTISLSTDIQNELDKICLPFVSRTGKVRFDNEEGDIIQFKGTQIYDDSLNFSVLSGAIYAAISNLAIDDISDIGSNFDALNNRYIIPTAGYYQFSMRGTLRAESGVVLIYPNKTVVPGFLVNGTTFIGGWANDTSGTIDNGGTPLPSGSSAYPIEPSLDAMYIMTSTPNSAIGYQTYTRDGIAPQNGQLLIPTFTNIDACNASTAYYFSAGDTVEPCFAAIGDPTAGGTIDIIATIESFQFEKSQIEPSGVFSLVKMAPEKYQLLDFLRDIMKLTNAVAVPNYSRYGVIDIITMNEYLASGSTVDWTYKLDESAEMSIIPSSEYQKRKQKFTYSEGSDVANQSYKIAGRIFGTLELYDTDSDFTTDENVVQLTASPTPNQLLNGSDIWTLPKFVDRDYNFNYPGARLLYFNFDYLFHINPEGGVVVGGPDGMDVPYIGQYDVPLPDLSSNDLNFAQEIPLHPIISAPVNTAYLKYYNNYLQELYSAESKVIQASFNLDVADVLNLNFNDSVFLFNSYWRVISMNDYNMGLNKSTRVTLIKKLQNVDLPATCFDTAVAIEKDGSVQWLNGGSQICCEQIGYYWDNVLNMCYKSGSQGTIKPVSTSPLSSVDKGFANLFNGQTLIKDPAATGTLVVGKSLTVTGTAKNSIVSGEDLVVQNRGIWYGGGSDGVLTNRSASGVMVWYAKDMFTNSTNAATVGSFLTLTNSIYTAEITLTVSSFIVTTAYIPDRVYSMQTYSVVTNVSGTATGENPHNLIIDVDPGIGPFQLGWVTNPTDSSIVDLKLKNLSGTYPTDQYYFTAQVRITQIGTI